jgi:predicted RNase H-like nuclease
MDTLSPDAWLAGADGCPTGWVVAFVQPATGVVTVRVVSHVHAILSAPEQPAILAIDMPIGLPGRAGPGGRPPERAVRPLLGARQSSVFSVPARAAIYAEIGPLSGMANIISTHRRVSAVARANSEPPRGVAIQAFMIFPKIRELDSVLRAEPSLARRVFEVHPEVAFWQLNGERALDLPKKVKSRPYPPGLALRRELLLASGLPADAVNAAPPQGAGADDLIDAFACAAVARRLFAGLARPFPDPPPRDEYGLPMAIWA